MKWVLTPILLVLIASCATSGPKSKSLSSISNEDFKPVNPVRYTKSSDRLSTVDSKFTESLNKESIARVDAYNGKFSSESELDTLAQLCHEREFKKAYSLVSTESRKYVKNPIFWNHVGSCFLLEGENRKALLFLNRSLSIKPNYVPALNNLGVMYLRLNDRSRALIAFKRAVRVGQFNKTPRFNLANLYLSYGLYKESLKALKPFSDNTSDVDVLNMKATANLMSGNIKKALSFFEKIDSDFREKAKYGLNYALALFLNGKKEQAIDAYEDINISKKSSWYDYSKQVKSTIGAKS